MHLPLIAHTRVYQMYVTVVCTRLKRALHFIIVLSQLRLQDDSTVKIQLHRMDYLSDSRRSLANEILSCAIAIE